jgi:hypothetical protein
MNNTLVNITETPFYFNDPPRYAGEINATLVTCNDACWSFSAVIGVLMIVVLVGIIWYYIRGGIK